MKNPNNKAVPYTALLYSLIIYAIAEKFNYGMEVVCSALQISTDYLLLGEVSSNDHPALTAKVSELTPAQYRYLEDIINSYITALKEK